MSSPHAISAAQPRRPARPDRRRYAPLRLALGVALAGAALAIVEAPAAHAAPLNDCVESDNGDPVVTSFVLSPHPVNVTRRGTRLRFRLHVQDRGGPGPASGVAEVWVGFGGTPTPEWPYANAPATSTRLGREPDGDWVGSILVPRGNRAGRISLGVLLKDRAHNIRALNARDLAAAGLPARVTVRSRRLDRDEPRLTSLRIRPTVVDVRTSPAVVHVTATARDLTAGVKQIRIEGLGPIPLTRVPGMRGTFRGTRTVGPWARPGTRRVRFAWVEDRVGNVEVLQYGDLVVAGLDRDLTILSRQDTRSPTLAWMRLAPAAADVRQTDRTATLRVRAKDRPAGIRSVTAILSGGNDSEQRLRLTTGTARRGIWQASIRIGHCEDWGTSAHAIVSLSDQAGHQRTYGAGRLARHRWASRIAITSADHRPPTAGAFSDQGRIAMTFDEAVNGISTDTAVVRVFVGENTNGPNVAGSWTCRDVANALTDCQDGSVRSARFRSDRPLGPTSYLVMLNPEFSLAVTDLAGNPFRRTVLELDCVSPDQPGCEE